MGSYMAVADYLVVLLLSPKLVHECQENARKLQVAVENSEALKL